MAIHNKHKGFTEQDGMRLRKMYNELNMTVAEISTLEGCGLNTLQKAFRRFGIVARPHSQKSQRYYNKMDDRWTNEARIKFANETPNQKRGELYYLKQFKDVHGDEYDYSKAEVDGCFDKIEIICIDHGSFLQTPANHASGTGCPLCAWTRLIGGYNEKHFERTPEAKDRAARFYIVRMKSKDGYEDFVKCGITTQTLSKRLSGQSEYKWSPLFETKCSLYEAFQQEKQFLDKHSCRQYLPQYKFNGYTECFNLSVVEHEEKLFDNSS